MDLIFRRYADPFLLIDQMLLAGRFGDFVAGLYKLEAEEQQWDFFLHKVLDQSWNDFKEGQKAAGTKVTKKELKETVKESFVLMQGFSPKGGGSG